MSNGKLLKTKGQPSTKMSGVSTMTKFRAEQALIGNLAARAERKIYRADPRRLGPNSFSREPHGPESQPCDATIVSDQDFPSLSRRSVPLPHRGFAILHAVRPSCCRICKVRLISNSLTGLWRRASSSVSYRRL